MGAVRASRFSEASPRRTQDYGRYTLANHRFNDNYNVICWSPDVQRPSCRRFSKYGASRDHNPRVHISCLGIHENEKRDRIENKQRFLAR